MQSRQLEKWHAYHIWCPHYKPPHHQKCVCVCPHRQWFLYINSEPPPSRKTRELSITLSSYEASFLTHASHVYPAPQTFPPGYVEESLTDEKNYLGPVGPSLVKRLKEMLATNPTLNDAQKSILEDGSGSSAVGDKK